MYSEAKAQHAVDFINLLPHTTGKWTGQPFALRPWQETVIRKLFGTLDRDGTRQYRQCYFEIPRKNGKSELAAAIALYLLFADNEGGAEIYSVAGDIEQAEIVFKVASQMVLKTMPERAKVVESRRRILPERNKIPTGDLYRVLSRESKTKHGYNPHGIIFDEVHVQPNRDLWDVLQTALGAREQPLTFAITTAGYDRNSICWELHEYALKVKNGLWKDPTFLPVIYAADEDADWTDEKVWSACNPALGDFRSLKEMRTLFHQAQERPALENTFRRLYLNQWTRSETRWMSLDKWDACVGDVNPALLVGERCYGGIDLASRVDIAAFALAFPRDDGRIKILMHYWIPADNIQARIKRDRVPYDVWVREGRMTATPGNRIDYRFILEYVKQCRDLYAFQEMAYDPWNADMFVQEVMDVAGQDFCVEGRQGYRTMSPPLKELEGLVFDRMIEHGGDPILRWMCDNMVVVMDPAGNLKPDKSKSTEKIDGMVALILAIDRALRNRESVYEDRGLLEFG